MARLKVLSALDTARTQWYHFKAIIIAGMGLFTDAYDLFSITPVMILIGQIYYADEDVSEPGTLPLTMTSAVVGVSLLGTVVGQLIFGWLGDRMGRKKVYAVSLLLMVFGSMASGFSICHTKPCVLSSLCFFRFWLGVGIGGDYPLSATIMSEFANKRTRGSFIAAVFSMQGFGILFSSAVTMIATSTFNYGPSAPSDFRPHVGADLAWRSILMFGAVPALVTYYWRMKMPETARYTALVERNIPQAVRDMEMLLDISLNNIQWETPPCPPSHGLFSREFLRRNGRDLAGCAASWFLVDIVFYSSTLFQSKIYQSDDPRFYSACKDAFRVARLQAIMAACSTIPGYWATVFLIDRIGRVKIQMMGFLVMAISLFAIGVPYAYWYKNDTHINGWFFILYGLTFFFSNFGPNTTTFIVPAELFPARFRSTCHGVAGAFGKVGAIIGSVGFLWASQSDKNHSKGDSNGIGMKYSLVLLGGICVLGFISTCLLTPPETNGRSLEENENDEELEEKKMIRWSLT
ncbi:hypothetical protein MRB53_012977 [Persea americana]|uniref:Uncharacterized protein n=1 Tax=Persea americana TaxID=3435 RepID=A0ACC2LZA8_PERAE|nr:hypothetical protein MRB53_012977 [Persea americana]